MFLLQNHQLKREQEQERIEAAEAETRKKLQELVKQEEEVSAFCVYKEAFLIY